MSDEYWTNLGGKKLQGCFILGGGGDDNGKNVLGVTKQVTLNRQYVHIH